MHTRHKYHVIVSYAGHYHESYSADYESAGPSYRPTPITCMHARGRLHVAHVHSSQGEPADLSLNRRSDGQDEIG